jgi:hypothetical protein
MQRDSVRRLVKTVFVAVTCAFPLAAFAQERYPALNADQLSAEQKAYVESLQTPPRNNTGALRNPPSRSICAAPAPL